MRRRIAHDYFHIFVECLQQPVETQRGAEAVAIGANVGSNRKAILFFNQFNYLAKHYKIADFELRISDCTANSFSNPKPALFRVLYPFRTVLDLFEERIDALCLLFDRIADKVKRRSMPQIERKAQLLAYIRR